MRIGTVRARAATRSCALVLTLLVFGCGDDDEGNANDGGLDGSTGGTGGPGADAAPGSITPLPDGVAGKPCTVNRDCDPGMCSAQVPSAGVLPMQLPAPGGYCIGPCMTDADCGDGGACVGALANFVMGQCLAECSTDTDCREGYLCGGGISFAGFVVPDTCRPVPDTDQLEDDVAGDMCMAAADCPGGSCLTMRAGILGGGTPLPGGYCTGNCLENSHCGAGGVCVPPALNLSGGTGSCYQSCASDDDCSRDGYRCREIQMGLRGCNPFPDPLPDDTAGDACSGDADCGGGMGTCAAQLPGPGFGGGSVPAPGGYCTQICGEEGDCGAGGLCVVTLFGGGNCFKPCATEADCREGYACAARGAGGGAPVADGGMPMPNLVCQPIPPPPDEDAGASTAAP